MDIYIENIDNTLVNASEMEGINYIESNTSIEYKVVFGNWHVWNGILKPRKDINDLTINEIKGLIKEDIKKDLQGE
jgi:hypothetical protein